MLSLFGAIVLLHLPTFVNTSQKNTQIKLLPQYHNRHDPAFFPLFVWVVDVGVVDPQEIV